jgi:chromosome partitioning protein
MSRCKVIAISNQKGGVTKTTTTANLGVALALSGKKVLLCDLDPQADLSCSLGYTDTDSLDVTMATALGKLIEDEPLEPTAGILHHAEGVDVMPSSIELSGLEMVLVTAMSREFTLKRWLDGVKGAYDYVLIDCMPSLGMITINALTAADQVLIPVQSHFLPAKGMVQLIKTVNKVKRQVNPNLKIAGILITLVDNRTNLAKNTIEAIKQGYGGHIPIFKSQIPLAVSAAETPMSGKSLFSYDAKSKVAQAYAELAQEVMDDGKAKSKAKSAHVR